MNDAKSFSLGEGQFLELPFALIGFGLAVRCAGQLVMGFERDGGPLAQPIIGTGRRQKLQREDRKQQENHSLSKHASHDALSLKKLRHRSMMSTPSAIPSASSHLRMTEAVDRND
jgi:hypothetical protein